MLRPKDFKKFFGRNPIFRKADYAWFFQKESKMAERFVAFTGPTSDDKIQSRKQIPAAEGVMGILALLAYWGGGTNLFPNDLNPEQFIHEKERNGVIKTDFHNLSCLTQEYGRAIGRTIKSVSTSSFPVYLVCLRKGKGANNNGEMIPVNVSYERDEQTITIFPRNYLADRSAPDPLYPRDPHKKIDLTALLPEGLL